eukprot:scaffold3761_cov372-Prasinococcus_capsulatus_cf.AAC.10
MSACIVVSSLDARFTPVDVGDMLGEEDSVFMELVGLVTAMAHGASWLCLPSYTMESTVVSLRSTLRLALVLVGGVRSARDGTVAVLRHEQVTDPFPGGLEGQTRHLGGKAQRTYGRVAGVLLTKVGQPCSRRLQDALVQ